MARLFEFVGNHPILVGLFAILLTLFVRNESQRGGRGVSPQELVNMMNRDGAVVIDVRDSKEFAGGHIVDAVNVPHSALESRVGELEKFKDKPVAIVCKMGQHAGTAGTILRKAGFSNVARLTGGMTEWRAQNLPVVKA